MSTPDNAVEIELDHFNHQPFQALSGRVKITGPIAAKSIQLRVFWFTQGRGDEEAEVVHRMTIDPHELVTAFNWKLPAAPYSFAGQLITMAWAVEVVDNKENSLDLVPFLLSPSGEEIQLEAVPDTSKKGKLAERFKNRQRR